MKTESRERVPEILSGPSGRIEWIDDIWIIVLMKSVYRRWKTVWRQRWWSVWVIEFVEELQVPNKTSHIFVNIFKCVAPQWLVLTGDETRQDLYILDYELRISKSASVPIAHCVALRNIMLYLSADLR